jgi:serine/threonine protein kinase
MSTVVAVMVALQMSQALLFLHQKRLVHNDVKPDNILVVQWRTPRNNYKHLVLAKLCDYDDDDKEEEGDEGENGCAAGARGTLALFQAQSSTYGA